MKENETEEPSVTEAELARVAELDAKATPCPACSGKGFIIDTTYDRTGEESFCYKCEGTGKYLIPAYVKELRTLTPRLARELAAARAHIAAIKREADKLHNECIRDGETDAYCLTSANIDALNTHTHE